MQLDSKISQIRWLVKLQEKRTDKRVHEVALFNLIRKRYQIMGVYSNGELKFWLCAKKKALFTSLGDHNYYSSGDINSNSLSIFGKFKKWTSTRSEEQSTNQLRGSSNLPKWLCRECSFAKLHPLLHFPPFGELKRTCTRQEEQNTKQL